MSSKVDVHTVLVKERFHKVFDRRVRGGADGVLPPVKLRRALARRKTSFHHRRARCACAGAARERTCFLLFGECVCGHVQVAVELSPISGVPLRRGLLAVAPWDGGKRVDQTRVCVF